MSNKAPRYYTANPDGTFCIYDAPYISESLSVSIVQSLDYYRRYFDLKKVWGNESPRFYQGVA